MIFQPLCSSRTMRFQDCVSQVCVLEGKVRVADRQNNMYIRPRVLSPLLPLPLPPKDSYYLKGDSTQVRELTLAPSHPVSWGRQSCREC